MPEWTVRYDRVLVGCGRKARNDWGRRCPPVRQTRKYNHGCLGFALTITEIWYNLVDLSHSCPTFIPTFTVALYSIYSRSVNEPPQITYPNVNKSIFYNMVSLTTKQTWSMAARFITSSLHRNVRHKTVRHLDVNVCNLETGTRGIENGIWTKKDGVTVYRWGTQSGLCFGMWVILPQRVLTESITNPVCSDGKYHFSNMLRWKVLHPIMFTRKVWLPQFVKIERITLRIC